MTEPAVSIAVVTGEPSGEKLGAELVSALRTEADRPLAFIGVGGAAMAAEGVDSLFPLSDIAVMGLLDVLPRARTVLARAKAAARAVVERRADVLVTVDSLSFSRRVAQAVRAQRPDIPWLHYVAPKLWAWRPGRARQLQNTVSELLCVLPFEPAFFAGFGVPARFVGHPVVERLGERQPGAFRTAAGIGPDTPLICVLPGSRLSEVRRLADVFGRAMGALAGRYPTVRAVVPTLPHVREAVSVALASWPVPVRLVDAEDEKFAAFVDADAALAASGTVTLELAAAGCPHVVGYRVGALSAMAARRLIRVRYVSLLNLLLDAPVVPERLQEDCNPTLLADDLARLLERDSVRIAQQAGFAEGLARLSAEPGIPPAVSAARRVIAHLEPSQ